jgi:hypothetical protein
MQWNVRGLGQAVEANGGIDVVAQNCLRQSKIAGQIPSRLMVRSFRESNPQGDPTRVAAIIPKLSDRILAPRWKPQALENPPFPYSN